MDIYGKLNNEVVKKEYAGSTTDTAKTIVDNTSNVIKTEVLKTPGQLIVDLRAIPGEEDFVWDGSETKTLHIPGLPDVEDLEQRMDTAEGNITALQGNVTDLQNKDIELENATERLEDLIDTEQQSRQNADSILQDNINTVEANAQKIQLEEEIDSETGEKTGRLEFYEYGSDNVTRYIQGGFQPDNKTIELNSERKLAGKVSSKLNLGMVYAWVNQNGKAYISLTDPEEVVVNVETLPDGSEAYDIETYNYSVQLLPNGSSEYNIGE